MVAARLLSRRDFMRNGFASVAFLCALPTQGSLGGRGAVTSAALRAQARSPFEPFRRDLPRIPELQPVRRTRTSDIYDVTIQDGMAEVLPGFETPIYGYDGVYPGPTIRARADREVVVTQRNRALVRVQRAPARRLGSRGPRRSPDGRHPARRELRVPLPQRAGRGEPLVPRPRARADVAHPLLRAGRDVRARGRPRAGARPAARRLRRADRDRRPRLQPRRLVPLRGEHRRRLPG